MNFWTSEEIKYLRKNYKKTRASLISGYLQRSIATVYKKAQVLGLKVSRREFISRKLKQDDISSFEKITTPEVAYILGLIWADGNVYKSPRNTIQISLLKEDMADILNIFQKTITWGVYSKNNGVSTLLAFTNRKLANLLRQNNYLTKSGSSASKILKLIPNSLKRYWWRGYFDGDGHLQLHGPDMHPRIYISACFSQDWNFAHQLSRGLGISGKVSKQICPRGKNSRFYFCSILSCLKFLNYIYGGQSFGLRRKYNKYLLLQKSVNIPAPKTSKYRGVYLRKDNGRYQALIKHKRQKISLGCYPNQILAAKAYDKTAKSLHGTSAQLNFK